jgi:uncharacterized protein VirK/YbjX
MHVFFFKSFLFAWIFFLFFPHPPHHFSNGPSLSRSLSGNNQWQYTLSILITSQLHCFQLRTIFNRKDFKFFSHGLCKEKQNILLQHMHKKNSLFWPINVEMSFNTKTRLQVITWSLVFVLMLISIFIDQIHQNPKYFFAHVFKKDVLFLCA